MKIIRKEELLKKLDPEKILFLQEEGFIRHYKKELTQPPVGLLKFPNGSLHIKYAHLENDPYCVVKLVTSFSRLQKNQKGNSDGCYLIFSAENGALSHVIFDEGILTNLRTVMASCVIIKKVFQKFPKKVGILGNGIIACEQARVLKNFFGINDFLFLGRREEALTSLENELRKEGIRAEGKLYSEESFLELAQSCPVIITTTSSKKPILSYNSFFKNNTIIALGADEKGKQELSCEFLNRADYLICDDKSQSLEDGEFQFLDNRSKNIYELGEILADPTFKFEENSLKIFDLTGMGVQDVQIVKSFL